MYLTVQLFVGGHWCDAALLHFEKPQGGTRDGVAVEYLADYFYEQGLDAYNDGLPLVDARATSVRYPVGLETKHSAFWPVFLQDLLPQGEAKNRLLRYLNLVSGDEGTAVQLLMRSAGSPIGNMRIKEAYQEEQARIADVETPGVTIEEIFARSDKFMEVADRFAMIASGSKGLQGEWPKVAMTLSADGLWYPDPVVADYDAKDHVIVKMVRSDEDIDWNILASEAPYLEIARSFGLDVGRPLRFQNGILVIPRFDRGIAERGMIRLGQESLYSADEVFEPEQVRYHEEYLATIRTFTSDPKASIVEYLLRDVLNVALGNPDNHGRNTAYAKDSKGSVRLAPVFDLAPMKLARSGVQRTTKWKCQPNRDYNPDWAEVCRVVAEGIMPAEELMATLSAKADFIKKLPSIASSVGVPAQAIETALNHEQVAEALNELSVVLQTRTPF